MKISQNPYEIPLNEDMIPTTNMEGDLRMIRVKVDGYFGSCFLHDRGWNSTKIVILFDQSHPTWGEAFMTKHFIFERPGRMYWGHEGNYVEIHTFLFTIDGRIDQFNELP